MHYLFTTTKVMDGFVIFITQKAVKKKMTTFFKHDRALVKIIPFCCFVAVFLTSPTNIDL